MGSIWEYYGGYFPVAGSMPVSKPLKAILRYTLALLQTKFPFPSISEKSFQKSATKYWKYEFHTICGCDEKCKFLFGILMAAYWECNMNQMVKEDYKTSQFPSDYQLYSIHLNVFSAILLQV